MDAKNAPPSCRLESLSQPSHSDSINDWLRQSDSTAYIGMRWHSGESSAMRSQEILHTLPRWVLDSKSLARLIRLSQTPRHQREYAQASTNRCKLQCRIMGNPIASQLNFETFLLAKVSRQQCARPPWLSGLCMSRVDKYVNEKKVVISIKFQAGPGSHISIRRCFIFLQIYSLHYLGHFDTFISQILHLTLCRLSNICTMSEDRWSAPPRKLKKDKKKGSGEQFRETEDQSIVKKSFAR